MKLTLDTNSLIDVEEKRPAALYIIQLVDLHRGGRTTVAVSAIGASERQRNHGYAATFAEFQEKLKDIDFDSLPLLVPIAYCDITYWDYCLYADPDDTLESQIHSVLFPNVPFKWKACDTTQSKPQDPLYKRWRNAKCDVLTMWCHIKQEGDVFITSDRNFHNKAEALTRLGVKCIAFPEKALALVLQG